MATNAQIAANGANAQLSTGPKTEAGKQAVSMNSLSHGLSSRQFAVLPSENPDDYAALLEALREGFRPEWIVENFLVEELARAEWKLRRIAAMERELLTSESNLAQWPKEDCSKDQVLLKLNRYENAARRAWYRAFSELRRIRMERSATYSPTQSARKPHTQNTFRQTTADYKTKPMPPQLAAELDRHKRRDPDFNPEFDRTQMSKELQKWFSKL